MDVLQVNQTEEEITNTIKGEDEMEDVKIIAWEIKELQAKIKDLEISNANLSNKVDDLEVKLDFLTHDIKKLEDVKKVQPFRSNQNARS